MGLDMFLYARTALRAYGSYSFNPGDSGKIEADYARKHALIGQVIAELDLPKEVATNTGLMLVEVQVGYWRKQNAIHQWFVQNVQNGVDNCGLYDVEREQLKELQSMCKIVLEAQSDPDIAEETAWAYLPPQEGFFFGDTVIDEWYYNNLKYTYELIEKLLSTDSIENFKYQSSW